MSVYVWNLHAMVDRAWCPIDHSVEELLWVWIWVLWEWIWVLCDVMCVFWAGRR